MSEATFGSQNLLNNAQGLTSRPIEINDKFALIDLDEGSELPYYPHELVTSQLIQHKLLPIQNDAILQELFGIKTNGFNIIYYSDKSVFQRSQDNNVRTASSVTTNIYAVKESSEIITEIDFNLGITSDPQERTETLKVGGELSGTGQGVTGKVLAEWTKGVKFAVSTGLNYTFKLVITQEVRADNSGKITLEFQNLILGARQRLHSSFKGADLDGVNDGIEPYLVLNMATDDGAASDSLLTSYQYYWDHLITNIENPFEGMGLIHFLSYPPHKKEFKDYTEFVSTLRSISKIQIEGSKDKPPGFGKIDVPAAMRGDLAHSAWWAGMAAPQFKRRLSHKAYLWSLRDHFYV